MNTMTDLRAAAETLLRGRDDWEDYWFYHAFRDHVKPLATHYLANHPPDDGEPVTEEWWDTVLPERDIQVWKDKPWNLTSRPAAQLENEKMTVFTETYTNTFHLVSCYTCGVIFAINGDMHRRAVKDKRGSVYCPACGNSMHWTGDTEAEKIRKEMQRKLEAEQRKADTARRRADRMEERAETAERRRRAAKGQVTRLKNRAAAGVCPCCNRTFQNLAKHMESQHPDFANTDD